MFVLIQNRWKNDYNFSRFHNWCYTEYSMHNTQKCMTTVFFLIKQSQASFQQLSDDNVKSYSGGYLRISSIESFYSIKDIYQVL